MSVFVSFNYSDKEMVGNLKGLGISELSIKWHYIETDLSNSGENAIDNEIRSQIRQCSVALFLVGDNAHNSPWIKREAKLAESLAVKRIVVRHPGTTGAPPPELSSIRPINWDREEIMKSLGL